MDDRRCFERKSASIRVEMTHVAFGTIIGFAKDISDGGASVLIEHNPIPPVGTIVSVKFKKVVGIINEEPVLMRVVHHNRNTIGLTFAVNTDSSEH